MKKLHRIVYSYLVLILLYSSSTTAQTTYDTTFHGWLARITVPENYDNTLDSTSIFVFITGLRETGTDPEMLSASGFHHPSVMLGEDWDGSVVVENDIHYPVYVTLIPNENWIAPQTLDPILTSIFERFRIRTNAIHLIGFSRGGNAVNRYAVWLTLNNFNKKYKSVTTITTMRAAAGWMDSDDLPIPTGVSRLAHYAQNGGKALIFEQINDLRDNDLAAAAMEEAAPGSVGFYWTNYGDGTHDTLLNVPFAHDYNNLTFSNANIVESIPQKQQKSIPIRNNLSIYQWALSQGDTSLVQVDDRPGNDDELEPGGSKEDEDEEDNDGKEVESSLNIYPNPVSNFLRILDARQHQVVVDQFVVHTIHGAVVAQGKNSSNINVSNLSRGIYIIQLLKDSVWHNRRFLKM